MLSKISHLFKLSASIIWQERTKYFIPFTLLCLMDVMLLFFQESLWANLINFFIGMIILGQITLWQKIRHGGNDKLLYILPGFVLYSFYYSVSFLFGLISLILPGIYALIYFSQASLIAVLDDEINDNYFKHSKMLVKKDTPLVAVLAIIFFILEIATYLPSGVSAFSIFCAIVGSYLTILANIMGCEVFYYLKQKA